MSEWIPVADRMPTRKDADMHGCVWASDGKIVWEQQWKQSASWEIGLGRGATHWMAKVKPEPPK